MTGLQYTVRDLYLTNYQISETSNRLTLRNLIKSISQHLSLINHKCRLSFIATCVSLKTDAVAAINQRTHAHTHTLSLCLSTILLFSPFSPFDIKTLATTLSLSIEIQILTYSLVLISKVSSIRKHFVSIA